MSTRERVRVMLEWFGRRQTIALPINSVVGCLIATILLMILSENNVRTLTRSEPSLGDVVDYDMSEVRLPRHGAQHREFGR